MSTQKFALEFVLCSSFNANSFALGDEVHFLSEIRELVRALGEVFSGAPLDALVVVVIGLLALGAVSGWYLHKLLRKKGLSGTSRSTDVPPPPKPCTTCANVQRLLAALDEQDDALWRFHSPNVPTGLLKDIRQHLRVVTFTNLKGGVGKTTLTANLAAYFHEQGHRVLLIDFDYQGSLSATILRAAGRDQTYSEADKLLSGALSAAEVAHQKNRLAPSLDRMTLIPAEYELSRQENRLLMRWLLEAERDDPRYALARFLASKDVLDEFSLVLVDTPPRLGLATLNGLCASTDVVVPAILNTMSIGNVRGLLAQLDRLFMKDLNPGLKVAGIVGVMTHNKVSLTPDEQQARLDAEEAAQKVLGSRAGGIDRIRQLSAKSGWLADAYVLVPTVPDTVRFPREGAIAYLNQNGSYQTEREVIDDLGAELARRIDL